MEPECPYRLLGISTTATEEDIIKAHRKLMKTHHPDKTDDPDATETSKRLNEAKDKALGILTSRKEKRQMENDLDQHVHMLKNYILKTTYDPIPMSTELHPKIKAAVADCKGRVGVLTGPYPEIDAYYLLVRDLMDRLKTEGEASREQIKNANRRITDLQAQLNAETAAREHAEKALAEKEYQISEMALQIDTLGKNLTTEKAHSARLAYLDDSITLLQNTLLQHEQTLMKFPSMLAEHVKNTHLAEDPGRNVPHNRTKENIETLLPSKRKHTRIFTADQTNTLTARLKIFIQDHLEITEGSTISSQSIKDAFELVEGPTTNTTIFFKTLKQTIDTMLFTNKIVRPVHHPSNGYRGLRLK